MTALCVAALSMACAIALQALVFRSPVRVVYRWRWTVFILTWQLVGVVAWWPDAFWPAAFLVLGYCHFYFVVDRSVTVRYMLYGPYDPFGRRRRDLEAAGYGRPSNPTIKGRLFIRFFRFWQWLLCAGLGG